MAFRKKTEKILSLKPDLLFVQECEQQVVDNYKVLVSGCDAALWFGENKHKGIGIFSFTGFNMSVAPFYNPSYKYIVPIVVDHILAFHIWAMPDPKNRKRSYVGQVWEAMQYYKPFINQQTILIGDFNSHVQWDKERPNGNHTHVVDFLAERNIVSVYHNVKDIQQGEEADPSIYLLKQKAKPYHLDYCFVPQSMISKKTKVEMGQFDDWISLSDHMPLVIQDLLI